MFFLVGKMRKFAEKNEVPLHIRDKGPFYQQAGLLFSAPLFVRMTSLLVLT
jgi:hypothetical protein